MPYRGFGVFKSSKIPIRDNLGRPCPFVAIAALPLSPTRRWRRSPPTFARCHIREAGSWRRTARRCQQRPRRSSTVSTCSSAKAGARAATSFQASTSPTARMSAPADNSRCRRCAPWHRPLPISRWTHSIAPRRGQAHVGGVRQEGGQRPRANRCGARRSRRLCRRVVIGPLRGSNRSDWRRRQPP